MEYEWTIESFSSEAAARAFADGLTYGDDPEWVVDDVHACRYEHGTWDVVFARTEEAEILRDDPDSVLETSPH